jgi:hypothetical protein
MLNLVRLKGQQFSLEIAARAESNKIVETVSKAA